MDLTTHGRYQYAPIRKRATYDWPNGTRLAVYIAVNLEHFAFGEGLGAELAPGGPQLDVLNFAWRDYGNRVGVWRLLELFDELRLPSCCLLNTSIYDYCPAAAGGFSSREATKSLRTGRSNAERQSTLPEPDERRLIQKTTDAISHQQGKPPRGWLGPWIAESRKTPDLLKECGYDYLLDWCMDDQPIWMQTRAGRIPFGALSPGGQRHPGHCGPQG